MYIARLPGGSFLRAEAALPRGAALLAELLVSLAGLGTARVLPND